MLASQTNLFARHFAHIGDEPENMKLDLFITDMDFEIAVIDTGSNGDVAFTVMMLDPTGKDEDLVVFAEEYKCRQQAIFAALSSAASDYAGARDLATTTANIEQFLSPSAII